MSGLSPLSNLLNAGRGARGAFANPFCSYADRALPTTLQEGWDWCDYIRIADGGLISRAHQRIAAFFITDIEVGGNSIENCSKVSEYLKNDMQLLRACASLGTDYSTYTNAFRSLHVPFIRHLTCSECGSDAPIRQLTDVRLRKDLGKLIEKQDPAEPISEFFQAHCPKCDKIMLHAHKDTTDVSKPVRVIAHSPRSIRIQYNRSTDERRYSEVLDKGEVRRILDNETFELETMPISRILAAVQGFDLEYADGKMFHLYKDGPSGLDMRGWGFPELIIAGKQAFYRCIMKRVNEAFALDWIVPLRLLTPAATSTLDPHQMLNMASVAAKVMGAVDQRRRDPAAWQFMPIPLQYSAHGGEGMNLVTHEMLNAANIEQLTTLGVPAELFNMTLQAQAAPTAIRLFENTNIEVYAGFCQFLQWAFNELKEVRGWDDCRVTMRSPRLADDLQNAQMVGQLSMAGKVSETALLRSLGLDRREEKRIQQQEMAEDMQMQREMSERQEREMAAEQLINGMGVTPQAAMGGMAGGMPGGAAGGMPAAPMGVGGDLPTSASTPQDLQGLAQEWASRILGSSPGDGRRLWDMIRSNRDLFAQVRLLVDQAKAQGESQGRQAVQQQAAQPQGA